MSHSAELSSLWTFLDNITNNLKSRRLADVFRFISFAPFETFGPHHHLRIEINHVKKGNCIIHLDGESINFVEGDTMIILSNVNHMFEAGSGGTTLMQLEFLPEIFSGFDLNFPNSMDGVNYISLFSEENRLIKIVNNIGIMRAVQRIVNELENKKSCYQYLVMMYYAELLVLIYRYMDENYLPICQNESLKKAISFIRFNFQHDINMNDVAMHAGISERYLRSLFSQYLNFSPLDYLKQIRINKSIELLRNTELSVKEVSFQCGFQSPQHFSRIFKQQTGISPREVTK